MVHSFRQIIDFWPTPKAMAVEIGGGLEGRDLERFIAAVQKWHQRDRIPSEWWLTVVESETGREKGLSIDDMAEIAAAKRQNPQPVEAAQ